MFFPNVEEITESNNQGLGIDFVFEKGQHILKSNGLLQECTDRENLENWILKVVLTQINAYEVYYRDETEKFGVSIYDYIGTKNRGYWLSEMKREIISQLENNSNIDYVKDYKVDLIGRKCNVSFTVVCGENIIRIDTKDIVYSNYTEAEALPDNNELELVGVLKFDGVITEDIIGDIKEVE